MFSNVERKFVMQISARGFTYKQHEIYFNEKLSYHFMHIYFTRYFTFLLAVLNNYAQTLIFDDVTS